MLTNPQDGKATCEGDAGFASPVGIQVVSQRGDAVYADEGAVFLGDIVEASAANAGEDKFDAQTDVIIDNGLESISFHTSCSKPIAVGDQFGSMRLVELVSTEGGTIGLPDPDPENPDGQHECVIPPPGSDVCEGKLQGVTLTYNGGDCAQGNNDQEGKATCNGDAGATAPVRIVCTKDGGGDTYLDTGDPANVNIGDMVDALAVNAGQATFAAQTDCTIYDEFGNWVQDVSFHTSCSKPIGIGDKFGSLEVFGLDSTEGGNAMAGTEVIYTYKVTNLSDVGVVNVSVFDDKLGEITGSPIGFMAAGEMVTLQAVAMISEDTVNVVTVSGQTENGGECPDVDDTVTVTVETPPEVTECDGRVSSFLMQYIGPDVPGPVTVEVAGDKFRNDPAVYDFPAGLVSGTVISGLGENGNTVDSTAHGQSQLGAKSYLTINGEEEVIHTSCSVPFVAGMPAPLDDPKGDPSSNWWVVSFTQE